MHPDPKVRSTLEFLLVDLEFRVRAGERIPPRTSTPPALAIVSLPPGDSYQLAVDLRHTYPEPKLVVLVREPTVPQLLGLFGHDVDRCFPEPIKVEAVLAAIRELLPEGPFPAGSETMPPFAIPSQSSTAQSTAPMPAPVPAAAPQPVYVPGGVSNPALAAPPAPRHYARPAAAPGAADGPMRLFGLPDEDRLMDAVDRKLADYKGFRGPLALIGSDKPAAERAGRKLAKLATNRDPVSVEPVSLNTIRKALAEGRTEQIWVVRSPEVIPPSDREWLGQLVGQREANTPRILLAVGGNPPEWMRSQNIASVRLPNDGLLER